MADLLVVDQRPKKQATQSVQQAECEKRVPLTSPAGNSELALA